jgi:hypothetical protein
MSHSKPNIRPREADEALSWFKKSPPGTHCLVLFPDLTTLRTVYSHYTKILLEDYNEIVLILPYYETTEMVRLALSRRDVSSRKINDSSGYSGLNVSKYVKEGSLMITDSIKGFFPSEVQSNIDEYDLNVGLAFTSYIGRLLKQAESQKKGGITVLSDLGSFHHFFYNGNQKLIEYERSLPKKYDGMNLKSFCLYHQDDFERKFSQKQQIELLDCHSRNIQLQFSGQRP